MSDEINITTVRMKKHTVDQIEVLKEQIHAASFSDMIRRAVDISDMVIGAIKKGGRIIVEDKKGKQSQILISGIHGVFNESR